LIIVFVTIAAAGTPAAAPAAIANTVYAAASASLSDIANG